MKFDETNKLKTSIIEALKNFIDEEFSGNQSKAAEFLGESRFNLKKYLVGDRRGLDKLIDLLKKTKKYEFTFKIKKY